MPIIRIILKNTHDTKEEKQEEEIYEMNDDGLTSLVVVHTPKCI